MILTVSKRGTSKLPLLALLPSLSEAGGPSRGNGIQLDRLILDAENFTDRDCAPNP